MNNNLIFSIQTLETDSGGSLKALKPDMTDVQSGGYGLYRGVPVAVIGKASRNNSMYDPASFVNAMTMRTGKFAKSLEEGHLEGEWGHPMHIQDKKAFVNRILQIDRTNVSHKFTRVWSEQSRDNQFIMVYADIRPFGPMGQYLDNSFKDPSGNTAFSLRSLTSDRPRLPSGVIPKKVLSLVTFDAVDCPGYEEASKRFMPSQEGMTPFIVKDEKDVSITVQEIIQFPDFVKVVGLESIRCQEILDIFERETVHVNRTLDIKGVYEPETNSIVTSTGRKSVFHNLY